MNASAMNTGIEDKLHVESAQAFITLRNEQRLKWMREVERPMLISVEAMLKARKQQETGK